MANIIIPFDNKNYPIDEASLSTASAALRTHLSSVMNGTGATINFGGVPYSIDSAKLSAATNSFVSHLGTVAGNGYKVMVGGVEYNVDSAKMTDAIADLHEVLGGLQSGGNSGVSETVILEEQTLNFDETGECVVNEVTPLFAYQDYVVIWDGVEYECKTFRYSENTHEYVKIGGDEIPFNILYAQDANVYFIFTDEYTSSVHTVAIYKVGDNSSSALFATQIVKGFHADSQYGGLYISGFAFPESGVTNNLTDSFTLEVGKTYIVEWDGVAYEVVGQDASILAAGAVGLGNGAAFGLNGNNEPFVLGVVAGQGVTFISLTETVNSHTIGIYKA